MNDTQDNSMMILGISLLLITLLAFLFFGLPLLRGNAVTPTPSALPTQDINNYNNETDINMPATSPGSDEAMPSSSPTSSTNINLDIGTTTSPRATTSPSSSPRSL